MTPPSRTTRPRRPVRGDAGQALVEFALVVPILLLLLLGIVDFARAWNVYQVLTDAAREGARTAVIDNPDIVESDVRDVIRGALSRAGLEPDSATISISGFRAGRGTPAEVEVDYPYELAFVGRFLDWLTGDPGLLLRTDVVMRNE